VAKGFSVVVTGDEKLTRAFRRAEGDISHEVDDAERESGETVAGAARSRAPRRSGRLRGSIRADGGVVSANTVYAGPIHFGWANRPNKARGWRGGPIRPNPFLWNALDDREHQVVQTFEKATNQVVGMVNRT
jgi:Bacteriophage HK97-gp10, putative tail-component